MFSLKKRKLKYAQKNNPATFESSLYQKHS